MNTKGVEDGISDEEVVKRVWIASYTASKFASVLCRGLHFRSIHDSREEAERMFHDPQSPDFTVTEYVKAEERTAGMEAKPTFAYQLAMSLARNGADAPHMQAKINRFLYDGKWKTTQGNR